MALLIKRSGKETPAVIKRGEITVIEYYFLFKTIYYVHQQCPRYNEIHQRLRFFVTEAIFVHYYSFVVGMKNVLFDLITVKAMINEKRVINGYSHASG